jgi:hypothetical protein
MRGPCRGRLIAPMPQATHLRRLAGVLLVGVVLLAGCGGDEPSSDPNSASYDPAETTLKDAGLEVCAEVQQQEVQTLASGPGVTNARSFDVAKDCNGKKASPDQISVFQFDSKEAVDAGTAKVKAAFPDAATLTKGPLIIVATGPNKDANLTAVEKALPEGL